MRTTEEWREQVDFLTIEAAAMFLRTLGQFHYKKFQVLCSDGYKRLDASDLCLNFNPSAPAAKVGPVYFCGGPSRINQYKGNYLTFIIDCVMAAQGEKGVEFIDDTVTYARSVCIGITPLPPLNYWQVCRLIKTLHKTSQPIEWGLEDIGLMPGDYDIEDVEDQLHDFGLYECESCGVWIQTDTLDGNCDCPSCSLRKMIT